MLRRLHKEQPESFAFTEANREWAEAQITKYPAGRQASAVIALLWRAQEQEGWLSRPAIEHVAGMLDMAYIRALEVATFYFMFQLSPVGSVTHVQICGTTSCMICGAEDLIGVCKDKIAARPHELSADGKFSWEEVECLGACANAPMAQIGKDYYEDLDAESFGKLLDRLAAGEVPEPGSAKGRFSSEPEGGKTVLEKDRVNEVNASVALAREIGDTLKRIDGTEVPLLTPWNPVEASAARVPPTYDPDLMPNVANIDGPTPGPRPGAGQSVEGDAMTEQQSSAEDKGRPEEGDVAGAEPARNADTAPDDGGDADASTADTAPAETGDADTAPDDGSDADASAADGGAGAVGKRTTADGSDGEAGTSALNDAAAGVEEGHEQRPRALDAPREGAADDLKRIKGVGPKLEETLHEMGIYHFDQIAALEAEELAWIDRNLEGFKGRVIRDDWVGQAKQLAREGQTDR